MLNAGEQCIVVNEAFRSVYGSAKDIVLRTVQ